MSKKVLEFTASRMFGWPTGYSEHCLMPAPAVKNRRLNVIQRVNGDAGSEKSKRMTGLGMLIFQPLGMNQIVIVPRLATR